MSISGDPADHDATFHRLCPGSGFASFFCATRPPLKKTRNPVVVELFTSQGCSSCPPADKLLHQLADQDDVIALALHVDYWDYIGWKDSFAQRAFTVRQKNYARAGGRKAIFTPQMIIGGREALVGHDAMTIAMTIQEQRKLPRAAQIDLVSRTEDGELITVRLTPIEGRPIGVVQLIRYIPEATVEIRRGENAGKALSYANIVRDWKVVGNWGGGETELELAVPGPNPAVLILQKDGQKDILAAQRLK